MEKRSISSVRVVVQKKKKKKPHKKEHVKLFRKVMAYLTSDSYMFAPLLSSHRFHSSSGVETEELLNVEKSNKTLMGRVADFLMSDCYMYAPLISPWQSSKCSSNSIGSPQTSGKLVDDREAPPKEMERKTIEDKQPDSYSPSKSTVLRKKVAYRETVKHMVQLNCRSSSVPGVLHEMEPAKLLVE